MKRRLALLLALSLSFASFPVAGVGAAEAETPAAVEQTVDEPEETKQEEIDETKDIEEADTDKSGEAAEAASVHRENPFIKPKTIEKIGWLMYSKRSQ